MKYFGKFGFATTAEDEDAPGVWKDTVTERDVIGDVIQRTEALSVSSSVIPVYRTTTSVSVLLDGILKESYKDLRYVEYMGENWAIASAVVEHPRLIVYIGEVYNGPTPEPAPPTP